MSNISLVAHTEAMLKEVMLPNNKLTVYTLIFLRVDLTERPDISDAHSFIVWPSPSCGAQLQLHV